MLQYLIRHVELMICLGTTSIDARLSMKKAHLFKLIIYLAYYL